MLQSLTNLERDLHSLVSRQNTHFSDQVLQVVSFNILHNQVVHRIYPPNIIDANYIRVRQAGYGLSLPPETVHKVIIAGELGAEYFYRHHPVQNGVTAFINNGHPSAAQLFQYFIPVPQELPNQYFHLRSWLNNDIL
jgi:hypothetical protein